MQLASLLLELAVSLTILEPKTLTSRPTRDRKTVERYSETSGPRSSTPKPLLGYNSEYSTPKTQINWSLSHPRVMGSLVMYRRSFLERKGLTKEEIDESFRRVPDPTSSFSGTQTIASNEGCYTYHVASVICLFITIGHEPATKFLDGQLELDSDEYVVAKPGKMLTCVSGVFAAGDVQDKNSRQAITAAGSDVVGILLKVKGVMEKVASFGQQKLFY